MLVSVVKNSLVNLVFLRTDRYLILISLDKIREMCSFPRFATPDRFKCVILGQALPNATISSVMKVCALSVSEKRVNLGSETPWKAATQLK